MSASVNVLDQLTDLPSTFQRPGAPFTQLIDSFNVGVTSFTSAVDAIVAQTFGTARFGWLDVWGAIFDIQRTTNEADGIYRQRVVFTLLAWVGTVPALEQWGLNVLNETITVTENVGSAGYNIEIPGTLSAAQIASFFASLARVRPAGVPFTVTQQSIGLYLDTIDYLDAYEVIGSYLTDDGDTSAPGVAALTNSSTPVLPEYYFSDPTLNPGISS